MSIIWLPDGYSLTLSRHLVFYFKYQFFLFTSAVFVFLFGGVGFWNWVESTLAHGLAPAQSFDAQIGAFDNPKAPHGFDHVFRTGRVKTTAISKQRTDNVLIPSQYWNEYASYHEKWLLIGRVSGIKFALIFMLINGVKTAHWKTQFSPYFSTRQNNAKHLRR